MQLLSLGLLTMVHAQGNAKILVVCGPSGSGKSSLISKLFADYPEQFGFSISHTTRTARSGEVDGVDYYFTNVDDMVKRIANNEFIESARFSDNLYGTSIHSVDNVLRTGKICVLDIDMQGVISVKNDPRLKALFVFIKPPSMEELERRLKARNTETEDSLKRRLATAKSELDYAEKMCHTFDKIITNEKLDRAYSEFVAFLAEKFGNLNLLKR